MHKKILVKAILNILLLAMLVFAGGCWDSHELSDLSLVTGIGIDALPNEENTPHNQVRYTVQIAKILGEKDNSEKKSANIEIKNSSFKDAAYVYSLSSSRKLFTQHNKVIIFGRKQAEEGINKQLDFFIRDYKTRMEVWLLVADEDAKEILNVDFDMEAISGLGIAKMMDSYTRSKKLYGVTMLNYAIQSMEHATVPTVGLINIVEENGKKRMDLKGLAIIKDGKMIGELDQTETRGYQWMIGSVNRGVVKVETPDLIASLSILKAKGTVKPVIKENNQIVLEGALSIGLMIDDIQGLEKAALKDIVYYLKTEAEKTIRQEIFLCLEKVQKLNCDIYGFGESLYHRHPKFWETIETDWDNIYPALTANLEIKVEIESIGNTKKTLPTGDDAHESE